MNEIEKQVHKALEDVLDPELHISLVDLGLIYKVKESKGHITITMTLTTIGCPLFPVIEKQVTQASMAVDGVEGVSINLTFDPPWSVDLMTENGKAILGI